MEGGIYADENWANRTSCTHAVQHAKESAATRNGVEVGGHVDDDWADRAVSTETDASDIGVGRSGFNYSVASLDRV